MLGRATATGTVLNDDTACAPRPQVTPTLTAGGGALQVHVESTPLNTPATNPLHQIHFGAFQNATVTMSGQPIVSGQTVTFSQHLTMTDSLVQRTTAGQASMVPFTIVDGCGDWSTFVGGGAAAGF